MKIYKYFNYFNYAIMCVLILVSAWNNDFKSMAYNCIILVLLYLWHTEIHKNKTTNVKSENVTVYIDKKP